jgi:hypothetical protein
MIPSPFGIGGNAAPRSIALDAAALRTTQNRGLMRLQIQLDKDALRQWHLDLVQALRAKDDVVVTVRWSAGDSGRMPADVERLFAVERRIHRLPPGRSARAASKAFERYVERAGDPDLVVDLAGNRGSTSVKTWQITFDGQPSETAAVSTLMSGFWPFVEVVDAADGPVTGGRPGSETPGVIVAAFEDILARCTDLVLAALDGARLATASQSVDVQPPRSITRRQVATHAAKSLAHAAVHRIYRLLYRAPHWRVGWRFVDGPDVVDLLGHPLSGWHTLPDDGFHFYADPFPIVVDGDTFLFIEDFDHRIGRGVISVVAFDDTGPIGTPHPVLEHEAHLSYPFVIESGGDVWMIPETSGAGTVELYRAARFPDRWEQEAVLLEGIAASDATPFRYGDRWWLSATVSGGGSFSDALHLWSADRLVGPWRPHPRNPVLVDIAMARPAGRVIFRDGRTIRPVQDGRGGYGSALTLTEITRLDDAAFEQRFLTGIEPGTRWPGRRLHTLNRAGRLECIDGSAWSPRLGRRSRSGPFRG